MNKKCMEKDLGHKIRKAHMAVDKYFNTSWKMADKEPTRMQCGTMHYLREHQDEDVFQKDLEEAFSMTGATATNILKVMEKEGLVTRIPMPHDARLKKIRLTEEGMALDEMARKNVERLEAGMKKGFTEEELTQFRGYLDRLTENIMELVKENN